MGREDSLEHLRKSLETEQGRLVIFFEFSPGQKDSQEKAVELVRDRQVQNVIFVGQHLIDSWKQGPLLFVPIKKSPRSYPPPENTNALVKLARPLVAKMVKDGVKQVITKARADLRLALQLESKEGTKIRQFIRERLDTQRKSLEKTLSDELEQSKLQKRIERYLQDKYATVGDQEFAVNAEADLKEKGMQSVLDSLVKEVFLVHYEESVIDLGKSLDRDWRAEREIFLRNLVNRVFPSQYYDPKASYGMKLLIFVVEGFKMILKTIFSWIRRICKSQSKEQIITEVASKFSERMMKHRKDLQTLMDACVEETMEHLYQKIHENLASLVEACKLDPAATQKLEQSLTKLLSLEEKKSILDRAAAPVISIWRTLFGWRSPQA